MRKQHSLSPGHLRTVVKARRPSAALALAVVAMVVAVGGYVVVHYSHAAGIVGDINNDGTVNVFDLSIMLSNWNTNYAAADLNADGTVNVFDLSILLSHWGQGGTSTPTPSPTPTPTSIGGNCTNPTWNTSDAEGTENIGGDTWWVNNDAWSGSHGPQTIYVCSPQSWYAVSNQPDNGGQVETYPDTEYDINGRGNATKTITQYTSITSTFSENFPAAGSWDAAYDMWTDDWSNETMAWNQWTGSEDFWGNCAEPGPNQNTCGEEPSVAATINGVAYHFLALGNQDSNGNPIQCTTANESDCELIFFRDNQVNSGSLDILGIYQWEVAHGYAKASDVPTQLEYGVEVCSTSGTETFPMTGLTFSVN